MALRATSALSYHFAWRIASNCLSLHHHFKVGYVGFFSFGGGLARLPPLLGGFHALSLSNGIPYSRSTFLVRAAAARDKMGPWVRAAAPPSKNMIFPSPRLCDNGKRYCNRCIVEKGLFFPRPSKARSHPTVVLGARGFFYEGALVPGRPVPESGNIGIS